jgi:hypothetical protein
MGQAYDRLAHSQEYRDARQEAEREGRPQFVVSRPLPDVLGPNWQQHVYGRSHQSQGRQPSQWRSDSEAFAVWRKQADGNWHLLTCFPRVDPDNTRRQASGVQTI